MSLRYSERIRSFFFFQQRHLKKKTEGENILPSPSAPLLLELSAIPLCVKGFVHKKKNGVVASFFYPFFIPSFKCYYVHGDCLQGNRM